MRSLSNSLPPACPALCCAGCRIPTAAWSQGFPTGKGQGSRQCHRGFQQLLSTAKSCQTSESLHRVAREVRGLLDPGVKENEMLGTRSSQWWMLAGNLLKLRKCFSIFRNSLICLRVKTELEKGAEQYSHTAVLIAFWMCARVCLNWISDFTGYLIL